MKKILISVIVVIIVIVVGVVWYRSMNSSPVMTAPNTTVTDANGNSTVASTATVKVNDKLSSYQNAELGFSIKYPTAWEKYETDNGVTFVMPIDSTQVSSVGKLQTDIGVASGKCAFPPVTTVKDRGTITVGSNTLNMISISNTTQGRGYFNRMYSLQKGEVCYVFTFSSVTLDPESKKLTGSNIVQAQNNNKAIINTADTSFIDMVKSFTFVASATGIDESKAPVKK